MNIARLLRLLLSRINCWVMPDGGGDAGDATGDVGGADLGGADDGMGQDAGSGGAPDAGAGGQQAEAPKSMLEAIERSFATPASGQPRDALGRFAGAPAGPDAKPAVAQPGATAAPAQKPAVAQQPGQKPAAPADDLLQMPEGLAPKAQERFQRLANTNRELTATNDTLTRQVGYITETFQQNGIQREQFEQAAEVLGMLNRGEFDKALGVLDEQRRLIALAMGKPLPGVDALAGHDDLRAAVERQEITEAHALELARHRFTQQGQQQRAQSQRQQQEAQQTVEQDHASGVLAVDKLCKHLQATDMDFAVIEAKIMPHVKTLFGGLHPSQWAAAFKAQYDLIKSVAGQRQPAPAAGQGPILRPTGQSGATRPSNMFEAMWGA